MCGGNGRTTAWEVVLPTCRARCHFFCQCGWVPAAHVKAPATRWTPAANGEQGQKRLQSVIGSLCEAPHMWTPEQRSRMSAKVEWLGWCAVVSCRGLAEAALAATPFVASRHVGQVGDPNPTLWPTRMAWKVCATESGLYTRADWCYANALTWRLN